MALLGLGVCLPGEQRANGDIPKPSTCTPSDPITFDVSPGAMIGDLPPGIQGITIDQEGRVGVVVLDGGNNIPDGRYSSATLENGYLVSAGRESTPAGCTMIITTNLDGKREITCKKNGCTEPCGLVTNIPANGQVTIACHCNLAVTPSGPAPTPAPSPGPTPSNG